MIDFEGIESQMRSQNIATLKDDRYAFKMSMETAIENQISTKSANIPSGLLPNALVQRVSAGELIYVGVQNNFHIFIVN